MFRRCDQIRRLSSFRRLWCEPVAECCSALLQGVVVARCCSVLLHCAVAVFCCSVLQRWSGSSTCLASVDSSASLLQCVVVNCSVSLQCVAAVYCAGCCRVLQCVAVCCKCDQIHPLVYLLVRVLQFVAVRAAAFYCCALLQSVVAMCCCSVLLQVAVCCCGVAL